MASVYSVLVIVSDTCITVYTQQTAAHSGESVGGCLLIVWLTMSAQKSTMVPPASQYTKEETSKKRMRHKGGFLTFDSAQFPLPSFVFSQEFQTLQAFALARFCLSIA